jgi:hypothetical protein
MDDRKFHKKYGRTKKEAKEDIMAYCFELKSA